MVRFHTGALPRLGGAGELCPAFENRATAQNGTGLVAQSAEQTAFNRKVAGSWPAEPTTAFIDNVLVKANEDMHGL